MDKISFKQKKYEEKSIFKKRRALLNLELN